jgi:hypothetical protein
MSWLEVGWDIARRHLESIRCARCGRASQLIESDGPVTCRVCVMAWGHLAADLGDGKVFREAGGLQLRHASHETFLLGCPLCRAERRWPATPSVEGRRRPRM